MNPAYIMGKCEESLIHIMLPFYSINKCKNKSSSRHSHFNNEQQARVQKLIVNPNPE